jgi:hypothetical protein
MRLQGYKSCRFKAFSVLQIIIRAREFDPGTVIKAAEGASPIFSAHVR